MPFWFGKGRKKNTAKDVVKRWEKSQVSTIANELVRIIPDQIPFLRDVASTSLAGILNKNLVFFTSEPEEISGDLYEIIEAARVKVGPGIPFIGKQFSFSINYSVKVDVKAKKVVEAKPDLSSLKIDLV
jgi:hypothetical protein